MGLEARKKPFAALSGVDMKNLENKNANEIAS
jgi:hypothetical protein